MAQASYSFQCLTDLENMIGLLEVDAAANSSLLLPSGTITVTENASPSSGTQAQKTRTVAGVAEIQSRLYNVGLRVSKLQRN